MAHLPPNPVAPAPAPVWGSLAFRTALEQTWRCAAFLTIRSPPRWSRISALAAQGNLSHYFGPFRVAFIHSIPPPLVADLPALVASGFLIADPRSPSAYSMPAQWDLVPPLPAAWGPVKVAAEVSWRLVGRVLNAVRIFSATFPAQNPAPLAGPPPDPLVAMAQLAQQRVEHEARWRRFGQPLRPSRDSLLPKLL
ncbi:hypothetical protein CYMTET_25377 [Cymbomonas tetramitiformis]|uniref:Uncharacterized protein n=1 Tax=Cymbomonas tetramitiformis TaxID=36881 RepID=A0AAE0FU70_9CHLO|nr:hypothetical protein CYMTET_25377 [Cymbomonas tetramitiformis]